MSLKCLQSVFTPLMALKLGVPGWYWVLMNDNFPRRRFSFEELVVVVVVVVVVVPVVVCPEVPPMTMVVVELGDVIVDNERGSAPPKIAT
eukprot:CAMPEP_0202955786 /NCGR_PEP_ID=MMETSP1396-20130829/308_1 /ASSEMBLY_ACC=CAM_ASM_000872 /TAXON_ID= /ORGANISM="Pseudokeronopsis sp., Strain Brazil" /LENGTH=89 /DNA_ID=CAMNT_0049672487 /DNA_START=182 /DNA_END=447 /DNA_ORIENTATION=-